MPGNSGLDCFCCSYHTKRACMVAVVIRPADGKDFLDMPKRKLEYLVRGIIWRDEHFSGKLFLEIAQAHCSRSFVKQLIQQSFRIA
jgi:hypothetical protein